MILTDDDICCFYHCYKDVPKTALVLEHFRKIYPSAPVRLVSDGGDNFAEVSVRFGCDYRHEKLNIGYPVNIPRPMMYEWMRRFLGACEWGSGRWVLLLEDDVLVRSRIKEPPYPMSGAYHRQHKWVFEGKLGERVFGKNPNLVNYGWGGGGGTLFDRAVAIESISRFMAHEDHDKIWRTLGLNGTDLWLTIMFMLAGLQYGPNPDLVECNKNKRWKETDCALVHQWKEKYW